MAKIINLTQHAATADQLAAGVVDLTGEDLQQLKKLLTFTTCPTAGEVGVRARQIADLLDKVDPPVLTEDGYSSILRTAMIAGAPYLMGPLTEALEDRFVRSLFSFSERVSVEETLPDGRVRKVGEFAHRGWVEGTTR